MSKSYDKGKSLEIRVAKLFRSKLGVQIERDKRSGAGSINKNDLSDWFREIPLAVEVKNHKIVKIKEWFRQAEGNASKGQAPTVVFNMDDEEILACLRFSDLLDFLVELKQQKAEIDDLRKPVKVIDEFEITDIGFSPLNGIEVNGDIKKSHKECRMGHLSDEYGYCQQQSCKFSRGYRPPKKGKK
jgi:hypothetical protein